MGRHSTGANGKSDPQEKMEMDRTYPGEACKKHNTGQAPARKEEKRSPQKYVEKRYGVRPEKVELHMAPAEKSSL